LAASTSEGEREGGGRRSKSDRETEKLALFGKKEGQFERPRLYRTEKKEPKHRREEVSSSFRDTGDTMSRPSGENRVGGGGRGQQKPSKIQDVAAAVKKLF